MGTHLLKKGAQQQGLRIRSIHILFFLKIRAYANVCYFSVRKENRIRAWQCIRTTDWDLVRCQLREQNKLKQLSAAVMLTSAKSTLENMVHDGPFDVSACALQLLRLPTYPGKKGTEQPPIFQPMATVAKRLPISATAEH